MCHRASGRIYSRLDERADRVTPPRGGAELREHRVEPPLQAIEEQPHRRHRELEAIRVVEHEDAERLGDELVRVAEVTLEERRVQMPHRVPLVVPVEAALAADEAERVEVIAERGAIAGEQRTAE